MFLYPWGDMHSLNLGWFLLQFKEWVEKIQEYLDNGGGTSENLANVIAPVFNAANYYSAGDYVLYNNELYKANQAVNPGTWNPDEWTRCLIVDEMGSGGGAGVDNVARLMIAGQYSANFGYQKYAICRYNDKLWMCNTNLPSGGEAWNASHWYEITVGAGLTGLRRSVDGLNDAIQTVIEVSTQNSQYPNNKLWIDEAGDSQIQVPTWAEMQALLSSIAAKETLVDETANLTLYPDRGLENGNFDLKTCIKKNGIVLASGRVHSLNPAVTANGYFFRLPQGFWPVGFNARGIALVTLEDNSSAGAVFTISPNNGYVEVPYSGSLKFKAVFFVACYPL